MPAINYPSEFDKITAYHKFRHIIADMAHNQLELVLLMILNGEELEHAMDIATSLPREEKRL